LNPIDIIVIITVVAGFILGFKDGFVRKLVGIIGFILALACVALFSAKVGLMIEDVFGIEFYLAEIIAGIAIFSGIILIFTFLKRVIHPFDKVNNLINQIVGGIVGMIQILYFLSAVLLIMNIFDFPNQDARERSTFYDKTYKIIPITIDYLSDYTPPPKQILEDYINEKDSLQ
jgi:membrane protein required for colicin V production